MAGDEDNARIWLGADVFVGDVGTTAPTDTTAEWPAGWDALGLLSEDGSEESREQESSDYYDWNGVLLRTEDRKHKITYTVTVLEDNPVVDAVVNPGSEAATVADVTTRERVRPRSARWAVGFELRDGDITTRKVWPVAKITSGNKSISPSGLAQRELTITPLGDEYEIEITDDPQAEVEGS